MTFSNIPLWQLGVWFKNPLPVPLLLAELGIDAYFSDPDGLTGLPWAYIADLFPGQFEPIPERLLFLVREPAGSSNLVSLSPSAAHTQTRPQCTHAHMHMYTHACTYH